MGFPSGFLAAFQRAVQSWLTPSSVFLARREYGAGTSSSRTASTDSYPRVPARAPSLASLSASSFPLWPTCALIQSKASHVWVASFEVWTCFFSD